MERYRVSGVPITQDGRLVGILTNRDLRFIEDPSVPIREVMTKENLVTVPVGTTLEEAKRILHQHRIEKLPVVDEHGVLRGLITVKDILKKIQYPQRLRRRPRAAARRRRDRHRRATSASGRRSWCAKGVDMLVLDSAHGHSAPGDRDAAPGARARPGGRPGLRQRGDRRRRPANSVELGADVVKVGMGPGAICTTRVVAGIGVPQVTAILDCAEAAEKRGRRDHRRRRDQLLRRHHQGDRGGRLGGDDRQPLRRDRGEPGRDDPLPGAPYKLYRGMGSIGAMQQGSRDRYFQLEDDDDGP